MNKLKKIGIISLIGLGVLGTSVSIFADDTDSSGSTNSPEKQGKMEMRDRGNSINKFIRTDLTDAEKTTLATLIKEHKETLKAFMDTNKGKMNDETVKAELKILKENHIAALLQYIATDKQEEFKKFVENNEPLMGDKGPKGNQNGMNQKGPMQTPLISPAISKKIDTLLEKYTTTETKIAWLNGVNTKIDILIGKYKSEKNKNILKALKDLINSKIDELNGNTTDEKIIDSILE